MQDVPAVVCVAVEHTVHTPMHATAFKRPSLPLARLVSMPYHPRRIRYGTRHSQRLSLFVSRGTGIRGPVLVAPCSCRAPELGWDDERADRETSEADFLALQVGKEWAEMSNGRRSFQVCLGSHFHRY